MRITRPQFMATMLVWTSLLAVENSIAHDVGHCVQISDDAARLACFDAATSTQSKAIDTDYATESESSRVAASERSTQSEQAEAAPQAATVDTAFTVSRVRQQPHGEHVVYLDNGDVWRESQASRYFPVAAGDSVTIKKRRFGGYRLIAPNGKAFTVQQVR